MFGEIIIIHDATSIVTIPSAAQINADFLILSNLLAPKFCPTAVVAVNAAEFPKI